MVTIPKKDEKQKTTRKTTVSIFVSVNRAMIDSGNGNTVSYRDEELAETIGK